MFIVIELQTNNGVTGNFVFAFGNLEDAYAKYYNILAAAAKSNVEIHTALILTADGSVVRCEHFEHPVEQVEVAEE